VRISRHDPNTIRRVLSAETAPLCLVRHEASGYLLGLTIPSSPSSRIKCQEGFLEPLARNALRNAWQTPARYGSETKRSSGHFAEGVRTIVGSKAGNPGVRMASRFAYVDGASGMLARSRIQ
jgi:hypothetical protein